MSSFKPFFPPLAKWKSSICEFLRRKMFLDNCNLSLTTICHQLCGSIAVIRDENQDLCEYSCIAQCVALIRQAASGTRRFNFHYFWYFIIVLFSFRNPSVDGTESETPCYLGLLWKSKYIESSLSQRFSGPENIDEAEYLLSVRAGNGFTLLPICFYVFKN